MGSKATAISIDPDDSMACLSREEQFALRFLADTRRDYLGLRVFRLPGGAPIVDRLVTAGWCVKWSIPGRRDYVFLTSWAMERLGLAVEEQYVYTRIRGERCRDTYTWDERPKLCHAEPWPPRRKPIKLKPEGRTSELPFPDMIPVYSRELFTDSDGTPNALPPAPEPVCNGWGTPVKVAGVVLFRELDLKALWKQEAAMRREKKKKAKRRKVRIRTPSAGRNGG